MSSLPTVQQPTYNTVLPMTGKKVSYRPFVVREEKILLIALQEENSKHMADTLKLILAACTFNKVDIDSLPQVDVEWLFVNVRNKAMTEGVDIISMCMSCKNEHRMMLDLSKIVVEQPKTIPKNPIQMSDNMWVKMRQPTLEMTYDIKMSNSVDDSIVMTANCMESIIHGENIISCDEQPLKDKVEWIESLSTPNLKKIKDFFDASPKLVFRETFKCEKCGHDNVIYMDSLNDFFE